MGNPGGIDAFLEKLHALSKSTIELSLKSASAPLLIKCYSSSADLDLWADVLRAGEERALHEVAINEFALSFLSLCQGQYRSAFKALRLVLELMLQATLLSANLLELKEWLSAKRDTSWTKIIDGGNGLFSKRFIGMFFEELSDRGDSFRTMAATIYTELSECTHGNVARQIIIPNSLEFNEDAFRLWLDKCEVVQDVICFVLA